MWLRGAWVLGLMACGAAEPPAALQEEPPAEVPVDAPVEAPPAVVFSGRALVAPACTECSLAERADRALIRVGSYLADAEAEPRFDAAIGVYGIRQHVDHPDLARAWDRAVAVADEDDDHLHRRIWIPAMETGPTNAWALPEEGMPSLNAVVGEALWCDRYPLRPEVLALLSGAMRDDGGYYTTHAAWALSLAKDRGCLDEATYATHREAILADLLAHQPRSLRPETVADVDLFAERLNGMLWLDHRGPEVARSVEVLVDLQREDGGWGEPTEAQNPYYGYHAAFVSGWALAQWRGQGEATP